MERSAYNALLDARNNLKRAAERFCADPSPSHEERLRAEMGRVQTLTAVVAEERMPQSITISLRGSK